MRAITEAGPNLIFTIEPQILILDSPDIISLSK